MYSVLKITEIKEKLLKNEKVLNTILKRHQCVLDSSGKLSFDSSILSILFAFLPLTLSVLSLFLFFNDKFLLSFPCLIFSVMTSLIFMHNSIAQQEKKNTLIHDDFIDISDTLSKEELQTLISFYEHNFYKDEDNKDKTYKFNLTDLINPVDLKDYPEEAKSVNKKKRDMYLDSVYNGEISKKSSPTEDFTTR